MKAKRIGNGIIAVIIGTPESLDLRHPPETYFQARDLDHSDKNLVLDHILAQKPRVLVLYHAVGLLRTPKVDLDRVENLLNIVDQILALALHLIRVLGPAPNQIRVKWRELDGG